MSPTAPLKNKELLLSASAAVAIWFVTRIVDHTTEGWIAPVVADTALIVAAGAVLVVLGRLATGQRVDHAVEKSSAQVSARLERTVRSGLDGVNAHSNELRAKQSRHEYLQEMSLQRLERAMATVSASVYPAPASGKNARPRVLYVTSNGSGLGHLTRLMAVAEASGFDSFLLTLSTAFEKARKRGHDVHYFPSARESGLSAPIWSRMFSGFMNDFLSTHRPDAVVFDGVWVYPGVTQACRLQGVPLVWMQRGCWKPGVDTSQRDNAIHVSDAVVVPGDYGCDETVLCGAHVNVERVEPISLVAREQLLPREEAVASLRLEPSKKHVLIQLGLGVINDTTSLRAAAIEAVRSLGPDWVAVLVGQPAVEETSLDGVVHIEAYPVSRYFAAFDTGIMAAGYNAVTEAIGLGLPSVLVPNQATLTDDQDRRARGAEEQGFAVVAREADEIASALTRLLDRIDDYRAKLDEAAPPIGAEETARHLEAVVERFSALRQ